MIWSDLCKGGQKKTKLLCVSLLFFDFLHDGDLLWQLQKELRATTAPEFLTLGSRTSESVPTQAQIKTICTLHALQPKLKGRGDNSARRREIGDKKRKWKSLKYVHLMNIVPPAAEKYTPKKLAFHQSKSHYSDFFSLAVIILIRDLLLFIILFQYLLLF